MSFTASEQTPEGVQDQQAAPDPTPAATPPAPAAPTPVSSQGPWSSDLAQVFADEAVRGQVDSFLREKVQPYTTRLEQQARANEQATNLWNNFETDPINTYVQVTHELLGEELANEFLEFAQNRLNGQQQEPAPTPTPEVPQNMTLTPEQQAAIEWSQQQQVKEYYGQQLAELKAKPENKDLVDLKDAKGNSVIEHIHPWVQVAGGDFDRPRSCFVGSCRSTVSRSQRCLRSRRRLHRTCSGLTLQLHSPAIRRSSSLSRRSTRLSTVGWSNSVRRAVPRRWERCDALVP